MQTTVILILIGFAIYGGDTSDLWTLYFSLQLVVYLYIYDTVLPANAEIFMAKFKHALEFEAINIQTYI